MNKRDVSKLRSDEAWTLGELRNGFLSDIERGGLPDIELYLDEALQAAWDMGFRSAREDR